MTARGVASRRTRVFSVLIGVFWVTIMLGGCDSSSPGVSSDDNLVIEDSLVVGGLELSPERSIVAFSVSIKDTISVYTAELNAIETLRKVSTHPWSEPLVVRANGDELVYMKRERDCGAAKVDLDSGVQSELVDGNILCPVSSHHVVWPENGEDLFYQPYQHYFSPKVASIHEASGQRSDVLEFAMPLAVEKDSLLVVFPGMAPDYINRFAFFSVESGVEFLSNDPEEYDFLVGQPFDPEMVADFSADLGVMAFSVRSSTGSRVYFREGGGKQFVNSFYSSDRIYSMKVGSDGYLYLAVYPTSRQTYGARIDRVRIVGGDGRYQRETVLSPHDVEGAYALEWAVFE